MADPKDDTLSLEELAPKANELEDAPPPPAVDPPNLNMSWPPELVEAGTFCEVAAPNEKLLDMACELFASVLPN